MDKITKNEQNKYKILVIDDQPINIQVVFSILADEYEVYMANSGKDAIAFCQNTLPDLFLVDINMPEMSGIELCRALKAKENTRDIPLIFITAYQNTIDENLCWDAGGVDFVTKPVNPTTLKNRIRFHLKIREQTLFLTKLAFLDGLTGVSNRLFFDAQLDKEWKRRERSNLPLSVIMIDVDFFKKYNDNYGHQAGDECLKKIAFMLKKIILRPFDVIARYGGDEFVCLLPDTDAAGALNLAKQFEAALGKLKLPHAYSTVSDYVSLSIGVATSVGCSNHDAKQLLELADKQLYQAKTNGRGRICSAVL